MKTAMQEFLDYMKEYNMILVKEGIEPNLLIKMLQHKAEKLLEKEKEQIKEAWYNGGVNGMGLFETNTGEEYYNETYFQQEDKTFKQKSKWTSVDNTKH
jgi:hypothetical protein